MNMWLCRKSKINCSNTPFKEAAASLWLRLLYFCQLHEFCHISCAARSAALFLLLRSPRLSMPSMATLWCFLYFFVFFFFVVHVVSPASCSFAAWQIIINFPLAMTTNISVWHVWKYLFACLAMRALSVYRVWLYYEYIDTCIVTIYHDIHIHMQLRSLCVASVSSRWLQENL